MKTKTQITFDLLCMFAFVLTACGLQSTPVPAPSPTFTSPPPTITLTPSPVPTETPSPTNTPTPANINVTGKIVNLSEFKGKLPENVTLRIIPSTVKPEPEYQLPFIQTRILLKSDGSYELVENLAETTIGEQGNFAFGVDSLPGGKYVIQLNPPYGSNSLIVGSLFAFSVEPYRLGNPLSFQAVENSSDFIFTMESDADGIVEFEILEGQAFPIFIKLGDVYLFEWETFVR